MATRIFLCNQTKNTDLEAEVKLAKVQIARGERYRSQWTCGNVKVIQVGNEVYFKRTVYQPCGFFAHGRIVAAEEKYQLRLRIQEFQKLSAAYHADDYCEEDDYLEQEDDYLEEEDDSERFPYSTRFRVVFEWDSVVDFTHPLDTNVLKKKPALHRAYFDPQGSGYRFNEKYVELLNDEWEKHTLKLSKQGKSITLANVHYDRGQENSIQGLYKTAIDNYTQCIQLSSNCYEAFYHCGLAPFKLKEYEKAIEDFTKTLLVEPRFADAYYNRALAYSEAEIGDDKSSIEDLQKAAELYEQYGWQDKYQEVLEFIKILIPDTTSKDLASTENQELQKTIELNSKPISNTAQLPVNETITDAVSETTAIDESQKISNVIDLNNTAEFKELAAAHNRVDAEYITPVSFKEAKERTTISIARRQGQSKFRQSLLKAYNYRCGITDCDAQEALEAAHIVPYAQYNETENTHPSNGLLLRADFYTRSLTST